MEDAFSVPFILSCFTFNVVVVVELQGDCILSFPFPAETNVLVPVFSQSTDVVVVNIVVFKFPILRFHSREKAEIKMETF